MNTRKSACVRRSGRLTLPLGRISLNFVLQGSMAPVSAECGVPIPAAETRPPVSVPPGVVAQVYTFPGSWLPNGIALRTDRRVGKYLDHEKKRVSFHTARARDHGSCVW